MSTLLQTNQVAEPMRPFTGVSIITPDGIKYAQPDDTIEIVGLDTNAPTIRAVGGGTACPGILPYGQIHRVMADDLPLTTLPVEKAYVSNSVEVYRNGQLLTPVLDYNLSAQTILFDQLTEAIDGDTFQIRYLIRG